MTSDDASTRYTYTNKFELRDTLHAEAKNLWLLVLRSLEMAACDGLPGTLAALHSLTPSVAWDHGAALAVREDLRGVGRMLRALSDPSELGLPTDGAPWLTVAVDAYCDEPGMAFVHRDASTYRAEEADVALRGIRAAVARVTSTLDAVPHPGDFDGRPVVRVIVGRQTVWGALVKVTAKRGRVRFALPGSAPDAPPVEVLVALEGRPDTVAEFWPTGVEKVCVSTSDHDLESVVRHGLGPRPAKQKKVAE